MARRRAAVGSLWWPSPRDALDRLNRATAALDPPFAVVDLDAFRTPTPATCCGAPAAGRSASPASRSAAARCSSARSPPTPGFRGTLAFTLPEALWLADHGLRDLVVAYPTVDRGALRALAAREDDAGIAVMVDDVAHWTDRPASRRPPAAPSPRERADPRLHRRRRQLAAARRARARSAPKRSPLHTPEQAAALAREIVARPGLRLVGLMAYEAQIAGVGDRPPAGRCSASRCARCSARPRASWRQRRAAIVAAVRARSRRWSSSTAAAPAAIELTAAEPAVTEVAAGSGLYGPTLFDAYSRFTPLPAALFALPVVRRPGPRRRRPRSAAATSPPAPATARGCRGRSCPPACGSTAARAPARCRRRCSARPPTALRDRRPRVVPPREGRRAVRALRRAAPDRGRPRRRDRADLSRRGTVLSVGDFAAHLLHFTADAHHLMR